MTNNRTLCILGNAVKILCAVIIAALAATGMAVYGAPVDGMLILLAFFVCYIQLPGMLLVRWSGMDKGHISTSLAAGAFTGWAFSILIYFVADALQSNILLAGTGPVMSAAYIWLVLSDRKKGRPVLRRLRPGKLSVAFCVFFVIVLLYCLAETQFLYVAPAMSDYSYMNPDKAYHMGLINSLSHDYPLESLWIHGRTIHYHVFSEMMLSIPVRLFDIQADVVTQSFGPILTAYCFGLAYYSFFREMSKKPERAGIYCLVVILANIYLTRTWTTSIAFKFILVNDNSSGYGMAAALVTIIVFDKWYSAFKADDKQHWKMLIILTALVMLTAGIKGPMGAVTVGGLWGTVLLGIILRKVSPKTVLPLFFITAGFLLVYFTVLGSKGQANASGDSIIAFAKIVDIAFWKHPLTDLLKSWGIPKIIRLAVLLVVYMVFFLTVFFVPFCIGYIRELILVLWGKKEYAPAKVLVYAEIMVGMVAMFLLNYSGHSQIYFGLVSAFLAPAVAFWFIEDMEEAAKNSPAARYTLRATVAVMAVMLFFTTWSLAVCMNTRIEDAIANSDPHGSPDTYLSVSNGEYEAMEWIENNTEEDALLATDRYYSVAPENYSYQNRWDNRFFLYGVYSNRFCYIAGSGYNMKEAEWPVRKQMIETNEKLYDEDYAGRGDLARELGVDYVVVSKRFTGDPELTNEDYELCFSNEDVDIYKIAG